ncbi:MAG: hypothetical protein Ct9H300mP28_08170 [Pseudomonadota bacterium]|nr:MAG: hypothetical protein Ct9H300mP28_08170 [Pseudomonadota bacterium]
MFRMDPFYPPRIDVARANFLPHVAGCTGSTSEKAVQGIYNLPDVAMLDMGDFVGGLLNFFANILFQNSL